MRLVGEIRDDEGGADDEMGRNANAVSGVDGSRIGNRVSILLKIVNKQQRRLGDHLRLSSFKTPMLMRNALRSGLYW